MSKVMLATGLIVVYGYFCEAFFAWYSGSDYERFMMWNRMFGPYWWAYWALITCNFASRSCCGSSASAPAPGPCSGSPSWSTSACGWSAT
jgi:hypothetical protein